MKALTLIQPWGGLIATGVKLVENRTWPPPTSMIGQRFAIHAGAKLDRETIEDLLDDGLVDHDSWRTKSAILAVATLTGYVVDGAVNPKYSIDRLAPEQRRWFNGPIGFVLADVRRLERPVACKGALQFWTLATEIEAAVLEQLA